MRGVSGNLGGGSGFKVQRFKGSRFRVLGSKVVKRSC